MKKEQWKRESYGDRLKRVRKKLKWSLADLSIYLDLGSKVNVLRYESGERFPEDLNTRGKLGEFIRRVERLTRKAARAEYGPLLARKKAETSNDDEASAGNSSPVKTRKQIARPANGEKTCSGNFSPVKMNKMGVSELMNGNFEDTGPGGALYRPIPDLVAAKARGTERCILCGNIRQPNSNYWGDLPELIASRALVLLKAGSQDADNADFARGYGSGILELLAAIMSRNRQQLLYLLEREGFVDTFLARPSFAERLAQYSVLFPVMPKPVERKLELP